MKQLLLSAFIVCASLLSQSLFADQTRLGDGVLQTAPELGQQRADFVAARNALSQGRRTAYLRLAEKVRDYPLYPYLEYWDLNRRIEQIPDSTVLGYMERYPDLYLSERLQRRWLEVQAKHGRWQTLVEHYPGDSDVELQCYYRRGLYKTGAKKAAFEGLETLWLAGRSQPRACDPLFAAWRESGGLTAELAWQRTQLAMAENQTSLARYLERYLDPETTQLSQLWRRMHRHPEETLRDHRLRRDTPDHRMIVAHGVKRLARRYPIKAAETWDMLVMEYNFSEQAFAETESYIAVALARDYAPEAMHWLSSMNVDDEEVRKWRILTAINQNDWDNALFWIKRLPADEAVSKRWRYWQARAYEETGKPDRARVLYQQLARERDYYGFLAADRVQSDYDFRHRPLAFNDDELTEVEQLPGIQRARELYLLNDTLNARREWYAAMNTLSSLDKQKVAVITHRWGWHDGAILTLSNADYYDDLDIRFPLPHHDQVTRNATQQKVDPSWAYAVMRQESAFAADARSPVGAMGLMQIMPNTGRLIARDLNTRLKNKIQLLEVDTNIRFGISYLRKVMNRFENTLLATAAYNAGSERVKSWLPDEETQSADIWVENMPFKETRHYVKQVMAFSAIYDERMQRPVTPLTQRMLVIKPTGSPAL